MVISKQGGPDLHEVLVPRAVVGLRGRGLAAEAITLLLGIS